MRPDRMAAASLTGLISIVGCSSLVGLEALRFEASGGAASSTGGGGGGTASGGGGAGQGGTASGGTSGGTGGGTASGGGGGGQGGTASGGGTGGTGTGGGAAGGGGGSVLSVEYGAVVADCIDPLAPDPDACEAAAGFGVMDVDHSVSPTGHPSHGFVRFDLDGQLAGKTVLGVTLRMVVVPYGGAASESSGEIWQVAPFDRAALFVAPPAKVGTVAVAPGQGAVAEGETIEWPLPTSLVAASASTYLGIFPLTDDGVGYWNVPNGSVPPRLVITYR